MTFDPHQPGTIHFIGLCGMGMSAAAVMMHELGWIVTGSDEGMFDPAKSYLVAMNLSCSTPHAPENIPDNVDAIVIGRHAKLTIENPEVAEAHKRGVPILSLPQVIAAVTQDKHAIVVAGSYGKSTTASIASWILVRAGKDPTFLANALCESLGATSHVGEGDIAVIEGDEYPSAHDDPRAKFLHYDARDLILTSADHDHVNIYPTLESYHEPYRNLIARLPRDGIISASAHGPHVMDLIRDYKGVVVTYALDDSTTDWYSSNMVLDSEGVHATVHGPHGETIAINAPVYGAFYIENMLGVIALLRTRGMVTAEEIEIALSEYSGVYGRTSRYSKNIFDIFGSSYPKARAGIEAIRAHFPSKKLVVVFEPHSFSWRSPEFVHWYDDVFNGVERVYIHEPAGNHGKARVGDTTIEDIKSRGNIPIAEITSGEKIILTPDEVGLVITSGDRKELYKLFTEQ